MIRFLLALVALIATSARAETWPTTDGDYVLKDFTFKSGEKLPELRIHYTTLGTPHRNSRGEIDNAVMALHGTGGSGKSLLVPQFADELFAPGAPFDLTKTYVILPDGLGHGQSSKPSDGLRMAFPKYDYDDMVVAQHRLLVEGLGVKQLKVILGTSMGCMHAFVWGETYPGFAERLAPFACQSVEIAGRNRMWRKMTIDAIEADPVWNGGNYTTQPLSGLRTSTYLGIIAGAKPLQCKRNSLRELLPKRRSTKALPPACAGWTPTTASIRSTLRAITTRRPCSNGSLCRFCGSIRRTISSIRLSSASPSAKSSACRVHASS